MKTDRNTKLKRRLALIIGMVMALSICTAAPAMAKTKTMTAYGEVYKTGKIVYCASGIGVHKVNLKTGKVKKLASGYCSYGMKKKGKYLYYQNCYPINSDLCRVNISTGKKKTLAKQIDVYAISNNKIYYTKWVNGNSTLAKRVMSLNGKNKKKTTVNAKQKYRVSNAKGYSVVSKCIRDHEFKFWLKTPSGKKYYLGKGEVW